jgi:hypothetical protein
LQVVDEHRLVFKLNNDVIKTFPVTFSKSLSGILKLIPVEILLVLISIAAALIMMYFTRHWIVLDPDVDEFADPDFVQE